MLLYKFSSTLYFNIVTTHGLLWAQTNRIQSAIFDAMDQNVHGLLCMQLSVLFRMQL